MRYFVALTAGILAFVAMMAFTQPAKEHEAKPVTVTEGRDLAEAVELGEELKLAEERLFTDSTKLYPVAPIFPEGTLATEKEDSK